MRDFFCFRNAREFNEMFGYQNGTRKNKILLAFLKSKEIFKFDRYLMRVNSMPRLKQVCMSEIGAEIDLWGGNSLFLNGRYYHLDGYTTDSYKGICCDGDNNSARYVKDDCLYKMRSGKLFRKIILESYFGSLLPEQVIVWLCEEFVTDWNTFASTHRESPYKLVTGLDSDLTFADIYGNGRNYQAPYMDSCMTGKNRHHFYDKSIKDCYPAALVKRDNPKQIVARCVVFNNVKDVNTGEIFRLAERQYSDIGDRGKRLLVQMLKDAKLIDGYKFIDAACSEATNFVDINDNSLSDRTFSISCSFKNNKILSYQDSFKFFHSDGTTTNVWDRDCVLDFATTSRDARVYYDTYHDTVHFSGHLVDVWVGGKKMKCHNLDLDDFILSWNTFYHREKDTQKCPVCGGLVGTHHLPEKAKSRVTGKTYCCQACKNFHEGAVGDAKKFFSVFDGTYADKASELTTAFVYYDIDYRKHGYKKVSIFKDTLNAMLSLDLACKWKGETYVGVAWDRLPYMTTEKKPMMLD